MRKNFQVNGLHCAIGHTNFCMNTHFSHRVKVSPVLTYNLKCSTYLWIFQLHFNSVKGFFYLRQKSLIFPKSIHFRDAGSVFDVRSRLYCESYVPDLNKSFIVFGNEVAVTFSK